MCQVEDLIGKFGCKTVGRPGGAKLGIEDEGINWEFGNNIYIYTTKYKTDKQ